MPRFLSIIPNLCRYAYQKQKGLGYSECVDQKRKKIKDQREQKFMTPLHEHCLCGQNFWVVV